jgi:hypothetical protein
MDAELSRKEDVCVAMKNKMDRCTRRHSAVLLRSCLGRCCVVVAIIEIWNKWSISHGITA